MKTRLFYVGPVVVWMAVLFVMSTPVGTSSHSVSIIERIVGLISPAYLASLTPSRLEALDYVFRKACHLTEYAILALLLLRAVRRGRPIINARMVLGALAFAAMYAATDEFHQRFVPSRTPSVWDVLIDSTGAAVALLAAWAVATIVARKRRKRLGERTEAEVVSGRDTTDALAGAGARGD